MAWLGTVVFNVTNKYYNYADINRETENLEYLVDEFNDLGFNLVLTKPTKSDYTNTDFPYVTDINNLRNNINQLLESTYPSVSNVININPDMIQEFNYSRANELETTLKALYDVIQLVVLSFKYSGTFSSGQEVIL